MPCVSVVMNCYNGECYLREAIDSVYAQTFTDWEIVFWDNASSDGSSDIAHEYGDRLRYFRSDRTFPLGKARNLAFAETRGEYIAILDVDDIWLPKKLEKQLTLFMSNPKLGLVFSNSIFFNEAGDICEIFDLDTPQRGFIFGDLLKSGSSFLSTETMIFRRSALNRLDSLFTDEFTAVQDYELALRIAYHFEFDYVQQPLSKWRKHDESDGSKYPIRIPREGVKMLERLQHEFPDIENRFAREFTECRKSMDYLFAMAEWKDNHGAKARGYLRPYLRDNKCFLIYILSLLLPYSGFTRMKNAFGRR